MLRLKQSLADPGFSRGEMPTPKGLLFDHFFPESWMKMRHFGRGGGGKGRPLRP